MNELIIKRASIFSLLLGALIGLVALIPSLILMCLFVLSCLSSIIIIAYMKKNEKYLGIIDNQQGAILGGIVGFFATVGFFASFSPMVTIIHLIFKKYYSYAIPDMLHSAPWLFFIVVIMVAAMFAVMNAVSGMGIAFVLNKIEEKPKDYDARLDIKIED